MITTAYFNHNVKSYLQKRAREINKRISGVKSLFNYDKDTKVVNIYTTHPGIWIGPCGKTIDEITQTVKALEPEIDRIALWECC